MKDTIKGPIAIDEVTSIAGNPQKPNEDNGRAIIRLDEPETAYVALFDGATDISGIDYGNKTNPPRFYAQIATDIALHHLQRTDTLHEAALQTIKTAAQLSKRHGYVTEETPHHALPTAAGAIGKISVDERSADFYTLADPSIVIQHPDGMLQCHNGTHSTAHLHQAFFESIGANTPELVAAWKASATHEDKLAKHQFVRDTGMNKPGGYNVFSIHPEIVDQGETFHVDLQEGLTHIYVLSDGIMRPVNDYKTEEGSPLWELNTLVDKINRSKGYRAIEELREIENGKTNTPHELKSSDDATVIHLTVEI